MFERRHRLRRELLGRRDTRGLDLDRDRAPGQRAEAGGNLEYEVDPDVAGHRVADSSLDIRGPDGLRPIVPALHGPRWPPSRHGADEDKQIGPKLLQSLRDRHGAVEEILHEHVRPEILRCQPLDGVPPEVEISLVELADPADQDASQRRRRRC